MARFKKGTMDGFNEVQPSCGDYEIIPDGIYPMQAVSTDIKEAKNGNGSFVEVWMKLTDGCYAGRQIIKRFTWENSNPKAERIGRGQLRNFALACGIAGEFEDSDALLNIPVLGNVCTVKGDGKYPDRNGIKSFMPMNDADFHDARDDCAVTDEASSSSAGEEDLGF